MYFDVLTQEIEMKNNNEIQQQHPGYGLKYESTALGYRIHVSVHYENNEEARKAVLQLPTQDYNDLRLSGIAIAPFGGCKD